MSIASKIIAGCTPIAGGSCDGVIIFEVQFFGPTSQVFTPFIWDYSLGIGDCITAPAHPNVAYACAVDQYIIAPAIDTYITVGPDCNDVPTNPWQKCKEAA